MPLALVLALLAGSPAPASVPAFDEAAGRRFADLALACVEVAYLERPGRATFVRPYGLARLLQLAAELRAWDDPEAHAWSTALAPLERAAAARAKIFCRRASARRT